MRRNKRLTTLSETATTGLLIGGATLLALDVGRRIFRQTMLFCPERKAVISWNPEDYGLPRERTEELWFETEDGEVLYGWYCRAKKPIASGLYCHGNTGNLTTTAHVMPHLLDSGINVMLFDYRGFGRSTGMPSLSGIVDDSVTAARLHEKIRPKHIPSILYGYSLGGAIAAQVIHRHPFDGLILQSTFTNLTDITRVSYPTLPLHLLSGRVYDTVRAVRELTVPVMILHGAADEVCLPWMAERIYEACGGPSKKLIMVDGGLHKNLYDLDPNSLVRAVNQFATELPCGPHIVQDPPPLLEQAIDHAFRYVRRHLRRRPIHQPL